MSSLSAWANGGFRPATGGGADVRPATSLACPGDRGPGRLRRLGGGPAGTDGPPVLNPEPVGYAAGFAP